MRYYRLILIIVFAVAVFLRIAFLKNIDYSGSMPDEKFYLNYSVYMAQDRAATPAVLVDGFINNPVHHIFPNPIRIGYILTASRWMRLINLYNYEALSCLSALFSILSLFIGYVFTKRLFGRETAFLSLALFAVSPLNLAFSRRPMQESMVYFFFILTLYLFYRVLKKENILSIAAFAVSFFILILVKESSLLLLPFFLIFIFLEKNFFSKELKIGPLLAALAVTLVCVFMAYLWVAGGFVNLLKLALIILFSPLDNPWAKAHLRGPLSKYAFDFFLLSPFTLILAAAFFIYYFINKELRTEACAYLVTFFVVFYLAYSIYIKNVRYVIALDFPIRIFAVIALSNMLAGLKTRRFAAAGTIVLLIACFDFFIFYRMYVQNPVFYDPVTGNLIGCWEKFVLK